MKKILLMKFPGLCLNEQVLKFLIKMNKVILLQFLRNKKKNIIKNDPTIDNIVQKSKKLFSKSKCNKILYKTMHTA